MHKIDLSMVPTRAGRICCRHRPVAEGLKVLPPLVCIHGLGSRSQAFDALIDSKAYPGPIYLMDLPGHGDSDKPATFEYSITAMAHVVLEVLDQFEVHPVNVLAHSMGGLIAVELSRMDPGRIHQLILVETPVMPGQIRISRSITQYGSEENFQDHFAEFTRSFSNSKRRSTQNFYQSLLACPAFVLYRCASSLVREVQSEKIQADLSSFNHVFYIWGALNREFLKPVIEWLRQINCHLIEIADAGHAVMEDNAPAFNEVIGHIFQLKDTGSFDP